MAGRSGSATLPKEFESIAQQVSRTPQPVRADSAAGEFDAAQAVNVMTTAILTTTAFRVEGMT